MSRMLVLVPRGRYVAEAVCDHWYTYYPQTNERMSATDVAMMTDVVPSMSDTLIQRGPFDAEDFRRRAEEWAGDHPGVPLMRTFPLAQVRISASKKHPHEDVIAHGRTGCANTND